LHIKAFDIYGLSEIMGPGVACDCEYHKGLHVYEDYFLPEIISPDTLKQVPEGETGELVFTTLNKEALPLIRYRTKDLTSIDYGPCECGRTLARISRFKGRSDDMLIIRGVNVFPSQVEAALLEVSETSPNYLLIVDRVNNQDTLEVLVEVDEKFFSDDMRALESLTKTITGVLKQALGLAVKVKLVEPKTIERSEGKAKRVIDKRHLV
jgi:phenylacetate-CoA ligase